MYEDETSPAPLSGDRRAKRRFWKYDPTVSTGTLLLLGELLIGFVIAYGVYTADKKETKMEIAQLQKDRLADQEVLKALLSKLDQLQQSLVPISVDIAVLKSRKEGK